MSSRYEPPPEFPLASPSSGIVHHLSGPNRYARTQTFHRRIMVGRCCCLRLASLTFIMRVGFSTSTLAYMLDSLVRVSRRVGKNHFGKIARSTLRPHAHRRTQTTRRIGPGLGSLCGCATSFCLTTENKTAASPCASRSLMKCWQPAMDRQKSPFTAEE